MGYYIKSSKAHYPYPVLASDRDDYKNSDQFDFKLTDLENDNNSFTFNVNINIKSNFLNKLILDKKAKIICYFSTNSQKKMYDVNQGSNEFNFKLDNFYNDNSDPIYVQAVIVPLKNILFNYCDEFNDKFNFDILYQSLYGEILAYSDLEKIYFKEADNIRGIFNVREVENLEIPFKINLNDDMLLIDVMPNINKYYQDTDKYKVGQISGLLFAYNALCRAIPELKSETTSYESKKWYTALSKFFEDKCISLEDEDDIDYLAHLVLDGLTTSAFKELNSIAKKASR